MVVGGEVLDGKIKQGAMVEIKRGETIVGRGEINELQQNKIKAQEVGKGFQFGANIKTSVKIEESDVLVVFEESVRKRGL